MKNKESVEECLRLAEKSLAKITPEMTLEEGEVYLNVAHNFLERANLLRNKSKV